MASWLRLPACNIGARVSVPLVCWLKKHFSSSLTHKNSVLWGTILTRAMISITVCRAVPSESSILTIRRMLSWPSLACMFPIHSSFHVQTSFNHLTYHFFNVYNTTFIKRRKHGVAGKMYLICNTAKTQRTWHVCLFLTITCHFYQSDPYCHPFRAPPPPALLLHQHGATDWMIIHTNIQPSGIFFTQGQGHRSRSKIKKKIGNSISWKIIIESLQFVVWSSP